MDMKAQDLNKLVIALEPLFPKMFPEDQRLAVELSRLLAGAWSALFHER